MCVCVCVRACMRVVGGLTDNPQHVLIILTIKQNTKYP